MFDSQSLFVLEVRAVQVRPAQVQRTPPGVRFAASYSKSQLLA